MTQLRTHIPSAKPIPETPESPHLRLTPQTPLPPASPKPQAATPPPSSPTPQSDPPLDQLFSLYLDPNLTIADIAFTLGISIFHTLQLIRQKDFHTLLDGFAQEHEQRAAYLARCNLDTAARTFLRLAEYSDKPETARKAAGAIVRMQAETRPQKVSPETQRRAATTLLTIEPPSLTPLPTNPDRKGVRRERNKNRRADRDFRRAERLADTLGITPENAAVKTETLEKRLQEIDELSRTINTSPKAAERRKPVAPGVSPG